MSRNQSDGDRPLILVCNDDGIDAPGIRSLVSVLRDLGEVVVVAPLDEQSAVGHAITIHSPVRARPWHLPGSNGDVLAWAIAGTPADCIKLAVNRLLPKRPDLVVAGINHGSNTAVNVIYSGTVGAAAEACMLGIPSVAVSLCTWDKHDFSPSAHFAERLARTVLSEGIPPGHLLNVNIPPRPLADIRGILVTRLARSRWEESFIERTDPFDLPYFWYSGKFVNLDTGESTDVDAVDKGYVSVTPLQLDLTAHAFMGTLRSWAWEEDGRA